MEPLGIKKESKSAKIKLWFGAISLTFLKSYRAAVGAKILFRVVSLPFPRLLLNMSAILLKIPYDFNRLLAEMWSSAGIDSHILMKERISGSLI